VQGYDITARQRFPGIPLGGGLTRLLLPLRAIQEKPMHKFSMPEELVARVVARVGRTHPFDRLEASRTAFVVIDMQN
jgi:hypothetical protein